MINWGLHRLLHNILLNLLYMAMHKIAFFSYLRGSLPHIYYNKEYSNTGEHAPSI